jgi:putative effector of murein hydrolase LrgA (UPF0299 family)
MTTHSFASTTPTTAKRSAATHRDSSTLLRRAFQVNAASSTGSALVFLAGGAALAERLGAPLPLAVTAGVLLVFAALVAWLSRRETIRPWAAWSVVVLDLLWVGATVLEIANGADTPTGKWVFGGMALFVAILADVQIFGILRMSRSRP